MASGYNEPVRALTSVLAQAGRPAELMEGSDGSRIVVLPHGGRVIGAFAAGSRDNFLWNNPSLRNVDSARALFNSGDWCNTGGDRTWVAPEADFFRPRYPDGGAYHQPRSLDPGNYSCARRGSAVVLENRLTLHSYRTGEDVLLVVGKVVEPLSGPPAGEDVSKDTRGLAMCGYTLHCSLDVIGGSRGTPVGIWNLLQLPHGGTMLMPVRAWTHPVTYFGAIPDADLDVGDSLIRWTMRAAGQQKIGLPPGAVTGRLGYLSGTRDALSLVVRDFPVDPAGLYVDAPMGGSSAQACAVQACSVHEEALGSFSELEYHTAAIGGHAEGSRIEDTSRVRCFRGPPERIERLAALLTGMPRLA